MLKHAHGQWQMGRPIVSAWQYLWVQTSSRAGDCSTFPATDYSQTVITCWSARRRSLIVRFSSWLNPRDKCVCWCILSSWHCDWTQTLIYNLQALVSLWDATIKFQIVWERLGDRLQECYVYYGSNVPASSAEECGVYFCFIMLTYITLKLANRPGKPLWHRQNRVSCRQSSLLHLLWLK